MNKVKEGIAVLKSVGIHSTEGAIEMFAIELVGSAIALAGTPPCGEKIQLVNKLMVAADTFMITHLEVQLDAARLTAKLEPHVTAAQLTIPVLEESLRKYQEAMKE